MRQLHVDWLLCVSWLRSCQISLWAVSGEQCHLLLQSLLVLRAQAQLPVPLGCKARHIVDHSSPALLALAAHPVKALLLYKDIKLAQLG